MKIGRYEIKKSSNEKTVEVPQAVYDAMTAEDKKSPWSQPDFNDTRPQLDPLTDGAGGNNVRLRTSPVNIHLIFSVALISDTLRTIINAIKGEVFKNGAEVVECFSMKCENCEKEFQTATDQCDDCGSTQLVEPDTQQRRKLEKWMGNVNDNNQDLIGLSEMLEDDVDTIDDLFVVAVKDYYQDQAGVIQGSIVVEFVRADPRWFELIEDKTGRPGYNDEGKAVMICPVHRKVITAMNELEATCSQCNRKLVHAHYRGLKPNGEYIYYMKDEVFHDSKYKRSLSYGTSPIISVWTKVSTLINMDTYMMKYYGKQRPPRGLLAVKTSNLESMTKAYMWMQEEFKKNPHQIPPLIIEDQGGQQKGSFIEFIDFMRSLDEMQFVECREEFRRTIGAVWKVMPIFQADIAKSGGMNNEGLQITVTNRAIEAGQKQFNERVYPWMLKQLGITDYKVQLVPNEQADEKAEQELKNLKAQYAQTMQGIGFDVTLNEDGEFEFGPLEEPIPSPSRQQQSGMPGAMPGQFPIGGPAPGMEQQAEGQPEGAKGNAEGTPITKSDLKRVERKLLKIARRQ